MKVFFPRTPQAWAPGVLLLLSFVFPGFSIAQTATSQQLKCNTCSLSFGKVQVGTEKKMWLTLTNKQPSGTPTGREFRQTWLQRNPREFALVATLWPRARDFGG